MFLCIADIPVGVNCKLFPVNCLEICHGSEKSPKPIMSQNSQYKQQTC